MRNWLKYMLNGLSHRERASCKKSGQYFRPEVEVLGPRISPAVIVVDNPASSGSGTLRMAIENANLTTAKDTIEFHVPTFFRPNVFKITLGKPLPTITHPLVIDGSTYQGGVQIDGSRLSTLGVFSDGLTFATGSSAVIRLSITGFSSGAGILFSGSGGSVVTNCLIGTNTKGESGIGNQTGIEIRDSVRNTIGGAVAVNNEGLMTGGNNVISGNLKHGILIRAPQEHGSSNVIAGNFIGTTPTGDGPLGNGETGIFLDGQDGFVEFNIIGGGTASGFTLRNVISGNGRNPNGNQAGVTIIGKNALFNALNGNFIGTDKEGVREIPNGFGVVIDKQARKNTIGSRTTSSNGFELSKPVNLISGNSLAGVRINDASGNGIFGNYIGPNLAGDTALPNLGGGIVIENGAANRIGAYLSATSRSQAAGNLISGNEKFGILLTGNEARLNRVEGNSIGPALGGRIAILDIVDRVVQPVGVDIVDGASANSIGGAVSADVRRDGTIRRPVNLISGNADVGVSISGEDSKLNVIAGNFIGTTANGAEALPIVDVRGTIYQAVGVDINEAVGSMVGQAGNGLQNVVSGNGTGIVITNGNRSSVRNNLIGLNSRGFRAVPNTQNGVFIEGFSKDTTIADNVISGKGQHGIEVLNSGSSKIVGNYIGTDSDGKNPVANGKWNNTHTRQTTSLAGLGLVRATSFPGISKTALKSAKRTPRAI